MPVEKPKRTCARHCAVAPGSASVADAMQALDMAAAVLAAVAAHREMLPPDIAIHAAKVRNLCLSAGLGLREPNNKVCGERSSPAPDHNAGRARSQ